jgi:hypothetical protein
MTFSAAFGSVTTPTDFFGNRPPAGSSNGWIYRTFSLFANIGKTVASITLAETSKHIVFGIRDSSGNNTFWINSTNQSTTSTTGYFTSSLSYFCIGKDGAAGGFGVGHMYEFFGWDANQRGNKIAIETNINQYYNIF